MAPNDVFYARVVPIYKKGDTGEHSNYRPVSLLNSFCKLYMIMMRQRLQVVLQNTITQTQYGFRPSYQTLLSNRVPIASIPFYRLGKGF